MDNYNINGNGFNNYTNYQTAPAVNTRSLVSSVFTWMFAGLALTTLTSLLFKFVPGLYEMMVVEQDGIKYQTMFGKIIGWAPLVMILIMSFGYKKLSYPALAVSFLAFSAVFGIGLSYIFSYYDIGAIYKAFVSATVLFGLMAFVGYTTKTDLTKLGSILMIGLIAIIISSLLNVFLFKSSQMDLIISIIGVIIFTGLTAYDMQKIKNMAAMNDGSATFKKLAVWGALDLYLDFINLFMFLLRIFGGRRN